MASTSTSEDTNVHVPFQVQKNDILFSGSTSYQVMDLIGEGYFSQVAKCLNLTTKEKVAVKIHNSDIEDIIQREVYMLNAIRALDPEKNNIVRFVESFRINNLSCLAFEMLDRSILDLMNAREMPSLTLNEIRPVIQQLLVALYALNGIGVLHGDLKPDNIMLVNHEHQPYRVKLIDFGLACPVNMLEVGEALQVCAYRAPEVTLGVPLSEAVDMWGVGCVMAYLCFDMHLFSDNCPYHCMEIMVKLLGQPDDDLLNAGIYSYLFFSKVEGSSSPGWRLKSPEEFEEGAGYEPQPSWNFFNMFTDLEDAVQMCQMKRDALEYEDTMAFLSLLKSCLHLDPSKRITPKQALNHPFIAMTHLANEKDTHLYAGEAHQFMAVCPVDYSNERLRLESIWKHLTTKMASTSTSEDTNVHVPFVVQKNDILFSCSTSYQVIDLIGEGSFSQVAKCLNLTTKEKVAVKIQYSDIEDIIQREVCMLNAIRALDPEKNNIVRFVESFRINNLSCLAFEMLDRSILDLMNAREMPSLTLNEIRPVIQQLLVALYALNGIGVLHGDLKPDNIMLVNLEHQPYRVKLIDFGLACPVNMLEVGEAFEVCAYRAPEVALGVPLSEAVDMWGVGCVMAYLCFDMQLFSENCPYHCMEIMVKLLGQPDDDFLNAGIYSNLFFSKVEGSSSPGWRLKSPEEFEEGTGYKPQPSWNFFNMFTDLEDAVQMCQMKRDALEYEDTMAFLSLLKSCLHLNPSKRITPKQALNHPFIAMTHLVNEKDTHLYAGEAHQFMAVCPVDYSNERLRLESIWKHSTTKMASTSTSEDTNVHVPFQVQKNDILFSCSTSYQVMDLIGEGSFSQVAKCLNLTTKEKVAVKIHNSDIEDIIQREVYMLNAIRALDPEKNNIVRFVESFRINNLSCLAFEMLDRSILDLMNAREMPSLTLNEIRPVIQQLLVALYALNGIGVLHGDLKPDNIMLVNHEHQPYRVKLIDFGLACPVNMLEVGEALQVCAYRAPEVTLGVPLSEAVDMWGVGCVMAYLCFDMHLFSDNCPYHCMEIMVKLLGQPDDDLLNAGIYSNLFFSKVEGSSSPGWRLKSPEEFEEERGYKPQPSWNFFNMFTDLEDAVQMCQMKRDALEYEDTMAFLSLLESCLHLDPSKRITPKQALNHPFIAMTHLVNEKDTHSYAGEAHQFMAVCPVDY